MSSEERQSPFFEINEHKLFYSFGQQSFYVVTFYAEDWDKNYFVISKNSWVKDDNGQLMQLKRGVFLTIPAARALVGVLKAAVEEAEAFELKRVLLKRQAQPKKPVDSDDHIAAYLKQYGIRTPAGAVGGPSDAVGPSAERAGAVGGGSGIEHQSDGHSITATNFYSTTASAGSGDSGGAVKQTKLCAPRKQQQKPEKAGAANARAGRPRKVLKADDDIDERDAGDGGEDDGNDSDTRM